MNIIDKLLGYLNRVFDKDPKAFAALRIMRAGAFTWSVAEGVLTLGYDDEEAVYDLSTVTIGDLFQAINALDGFTAVVGDVGRTGLNGQVLIDGSGSSAGEQAVLLGFTSLLWAYYAAVGKELRAMRAEIPHMLLQMDPNTGEGIWLDEIGSYYGVPRFSGEVDQAYGPRIIAETLRPRANNVALEMAIEAYTGQAAEVVDVVVYGDVFPLHNGVISRDGTYTRNADAVPIYGLFDVIYGYDLENGSDLTIFQTILRSLIARLRAAGTHLRALVIRSSELADTATSGSDVLVVTGAVTLDDTAALPLDEVSSLSGVIGLSDAVSTPAESASISFDITTMRNGLALRNGTRIHSQFAVATEDLEGTNRVIVPA